MLEATITNGGTLSASIGNVRSVTVQGTDTTYTISKVTYEPGVGVTSTGIDVVLTSSAGDEQSINIPVFTSTTGLVPQPNDGEDEQFLKSDGTWDNVTKEDVGLANVTNNRQVKALEDLTSQGTTRNNKIVAFSGADGATIKDSGISISDITTAIGKQTLYELTATWTDNEKYVIPISQVGGSYTYIPGAIVQVTFDVTNSIDAPVLYLGTLGRYIYQNNAKVKANQLEAGKKYLLMWMTPPTASSNTGYWSIVNNSNMVGATASAAGVAGFVPAPTSANRNKFLRGDGTWATPNESISEPQELGIDQDLNSITSPGFYWIQKQNTALNSPRISGESGYGQSFSLTVTKSSSTSIVQVLVYTGSTNPAQTYYQETYQRRKMGSAGWSPWIKVLTEQDLVVCTAEEYTADQNRTALLYFIKEVTT